MGHEHRDEEDLPLDSPPAPEAQLMHEGAVTTSSPAPLTPDLAPDARFEDLDREATEQAVLDVRRREHSGDV